MSNGWVPNSSFAETLLEGVWQDFVGGQTALRFRAAPKQVDSRLLSLLRPDEQTQATSITSPERLREWVGGRLALNELREALGAEAKFLTSLSHSRGQVLVIGLVPSPETHGQSAFRGIGADLEWSKRPVHPKVKARVVTPEEDQHGLRVLDFWSIKEACLKANLKGAGTVVSAYRVVKFQKMEQGLLPGMGEGEVIGPGGRAFRFCLLEIEGWILTLAQGL